MKRNMTQAERTLLYKGWMFVPVAAFILLGITAFCWVLLPPEPLQMLNISMVPPDDMKEAKDQQMGGRPQKGAKKKSWFEKLVSGMRAKAEGKQIARRSRKGGKNLGVTTQSAVASTLTSEEQMVVRQMIIAEEQLASVEGRAPRSVVERLSTPYPNYPWNLYEAQRLSVRILGEQYERTYSPAVVDNYARVASAVAGSEYSNFEDYFFAGHANLFAGNVRAARRYLLQAEDDWPVKRGTMRGLCSLMILMCDAIGNRQDDFFKRLNRLQSTFPDWMFTEIYLPDLERLQAAHPRAPLLHVLHGRMLDLTFNDAGALYHYNQAAGLVGSSRRVVEEWKQQLEARRP